MTHYERDARKLAAAGAEGVEGIYYQTLTGMTGEARVDDKTHGGGDEETPRSGAVSQVHMPRLTPLCFVFGIKIAGRRRSGRPFRVLQPSLYL